MLPRRYSSLTFLSQTHSSLWFSCIFPRSLLPVLSIFVYLPCTFYIHLISKFSFLHLFYCLCTSSFLSESWSYPIYHGVIYSLFFCLTHLSECIFVPLTNLLKLSFLTFFSSPPYISPLRLIISPCFTLTPSHYPQSSTHYFHILSFRLYVTVAPVTPLLIFVHMLYPTFRSSVVILFITFSLPVMMSTSSVFCHLSLMSQLPFLNLSSFSSISFFRCSILPS